MSRSTAAVARQARHKKILKQAKGFRGRRSKTYRNAIQSVEKALQYAYRDRRNRKRQFRALWIQRINAGAREHGMTYARFMDGIHKAGIEVDRKVLADLAVHDPQAFEALVDQARAQLGA